MKLKIDEFENYAKRNGVSPRLMLQKLGGGRLAYKHLKNGCALGYELGGYRGNRRCVSFPYQRNCGTCNVKEYR